MDILRERAGCGTELGYEETGGLENLGRAGQRESGTQRNNTLPETVEGIP